MKKLLFYLCILFSNYAFGQIIYRCPVCPPSLAGVTSGWVLTDSSGVARWRPVSSTAWGISGNSGTTSSNFLGTTSNVSLRFRTNNSERMVIDSTGKVGVGMEPVGAILSVKGLIGVFSENIDAVTTFEQPNSAGGSGCDFIMPDTCPAYNGEFLTSLNDGTWVWSGSNIMLSGSNVGIGTTSPAAKLHVAGTLRFVTGNQGANKVLVSDADGDADWAENIPTLSPTINTTAGDAASINTRSGRFRKDVTGATFTLTNSTITANTPVFLQIVTVGLTAGNAQPIVVAGAGSAVITFQSAAGAAEAPNANCDVNFYVITQ